MIVPGVFDVPDWMETIDLDELQDRLKLTAAEANHPMKNLDGGGFRDLCLSDDQTATTAYVIGMLDMIEAMRVNGLIDTNLCLREDAKLLHDMFCGYLIDPEAQKERAAIAFLDAIEHNFRCLKSPEPAISRSTLH